MVLGNELIFCDETVFKNLRSSKLTFLEVYNEILQFIAVDKESSYKISIGTDSQVAASTVFVSCIHIHRVGKGAIGFLHRNEMTRPVRSLREKIYLETCASLQIAYLFEGERIDRIKRAVGSSPVLSGAGSGAVGNKGVTFEFHIDVGNKGQTRTLINEMVGMVQGLDFIPRIKPDSYCASCFADRYTKAM